MSINQILSRESIDFEVLYAFFAYLHNRNEVEHHPIQQLMSRMTEKIDELGLSEHFNIDMRNDFFESKKSGVLIIRLFNINFEGSIKTIDSTKFSTSIDFINNQTITGFELHFDNISFDDSTPCSNKYLKLRIRGCNDEFKSLLSINTCCFSSYGLCTDSFNEVTINHSASISPLSIEKETESVNIINSTVLDIKINSTNLTYLNVRNSQIRSINEKYFINLMESVRFLQFDQTSSIIFNSYSAYKNLRQIANKNQDKIQSFIFYKKELESFANQRETDLDSKILLFFNNLANRNGTSIFLPIFWLFGLNLFFLLFICIAELQGGRDVGMDFLYNFINILPTSTLVNGDFNNLSEGVDGLRRIICAIFIFLTISSALRFKYKG